MAILEDLFGESWIMPTLVAACAGAALFLFYENQEKEHQLSVLQFHNRQLNATLTLKNIERERESNATMERERAYQEQNNKLSDVAAQIRQLGKSNDIMRSAVPADALRLLNGYDDGKHETARTGAPVAASSNATANR